MNKPAKIPVRRATPADSREVGRLLHDFNTEFSEPSPGVEVLAERAGPMLAAGEMTVLLGGPGTGETDTAARALYESCGFSNREGGPDGPRIFFYEREL